MNDQDNPVQPELPGIALNAAFEMQLDRLRADLARIRTELDALQALADRAGLSRGKRYYRYLDTLERKEADIREAIAGVERPNEQVVRRIQKGVKEAWQRLAIAKTVAEARFH